MNPDTVSILCVCLFVYAPSSGLLSLLGLEGENVPVMKQFVAQIFLQIYFKVSVQQFNKHSI